MKELIKKPWFLGIIMIGLLLMVFFLNLWILSIDLLWPYQGNLWLLARELTDGDFVNIFAFIFKILFFISIGPILYSGYSVIKKHNKGFFVAIIFFIGYETLLIVFQSLYQYLSTFALVLIILNIIISVGTVVLLIFRGKELSQLIDFQKNEKEINLTTSKIPLSILIVDMISVLILLTTFIIPLYSVVVSNSTYYGILAKVLFSGETRLEIIIYFLVNFALFLSVLLYFAHGISFYFYDKRNFIKKSKTLISFVFIVTVLFFLMGLTMVMYHTLLDHSAQTISYFPLLFMSAIIFLFSIFIGKFHAINQSVNPEVTIKYARIESLIYVLILSAITVVMLIFDIIKIQIVSGSFTDNINLTGIAILRDYASLDPGYRFIAFVLVVMLVSSSISLVVAISSYLAKYRRFDSVVKSTAAVNIFFIFIISISGFYFQIGQEIDKAVILDIIQYYGIIIPGNVADYEYSISTDAIYALIASIAVLVIMFIRKAFDRDELNLSDSSFLPTNEPIVDEPISQSSNGMDEDSPNNFDPCPAFTELDSKFDYFQKELERRDSGVAAVLNDRAGNHRLPQSAFAAAP